MQVPRVKYQRLCAMRQLQLTARAYHRVLKLSRTIADLAGIEAITPAVQCENMKLIVGIVLIVLGICSLCPLVIGLINALSR
jgi:membrane-associated PAP2 superfamily phosphatase